MPSRPVARPLAPRDSAMTPGDSLVPGHMAAKGQPQHQKFRNRWNAVEFRFNV